MIVLQWDEFLASQENSNGAITDLDIYLVDDNGRRVAAFGYWAGYAGAAISLKCWMAQQRGQIAGPVSRYAGRDALLADLGAEMADIKATRPRAIIIGALGRVGTGADLLEARPEVFDRYVDAAAEASGLDLRKLCLEAPIDGSLSESIARAKCFLNECVLVFELL